MFDLFRYYLYTVVDLFTAPDSVHTLHGGSLAGLHKHASPPVQGLLMHLEHTFAGLGSRRIKECQVGNKQERAGESGRVRKKERKRDKEKKR